jgi:hypothetical protein
MVRNALLKKGFVVEEDGSHQKLRLWVDGSQTKIYTFHSHGAKECNDYILGSMARHLKLSRAQLDDFIDCAMSGEAYVGMLRERGDIKTRTGGA